MNHKLEITDPVTGMPRILPLAEAPIYDKATNSLQFTIKKTAFKSDFLMNLMQLESYSKAPAKIRAEAAQARQVLNELLNEIRIDETKPGNTPSYIFDLNDPDKVGSVALTDAETGQRHRAILSELEALRDEGGPRVAKLNAELNEINEKLEAAHLLYEDKQSELIESVVKYYLGTEAARVALWLIDNSTDISRALAVLRKPGKVKPALAPLSTFRRSSHLTNQILSYQRPDDTALSLFDNLTPRVQEKIENAGVERTKVAKGIRLSTSQQKVVDSLCRLLAEKSQNSDADAPNFYTGNEAIQRVPFGDGGEMEVTPNLRITLYELAKIYKGGSEVNGKDVDNVFTVVKELADTPFLIDYVERRYKNPNSRAYTERSIQGFAPLLSIYKQTDREVNSEEVEIRSRSEIYIWLHPIFHHQIDTNFIKYPSDINQRTILAARNEKAKVSVYRFRDYLMRERTYKHWQAEINESNLLFLLNDRFMKEGKRGRVKKEAAEAIDVAKRLGLLLKHEVVEGAQGQPKYVFTLNPEWE